MKLFLCAALAAFSAAALSAAVDDGITLIGVGKVAGNSDDGSGLTGTICMKDNTSVCIPRNTFGGFGSDITYTGHDNVFISAPDRGPFDGRTNVPYLDRFHFLHITVDTSSAVNISSPNINFLLLDTRFLKNEANTNFVGDAYAFNLNNPLLNLRLDPEAIRVSLQGTFFISDEYGPYILEFDRQGHLIRRITVPAKFLLANPPGGPNPSGDLDANANSVELQNNTSGRQANRGMEGLAITPDGKWLVGIMQSALLQDHGWDIPSASRVGFNNRILKVNLETGETHEYVYVMDAVNQGRGVNEMLAINDHEFLVLERDNRTKNPLPGGSVQTPNIKKLYKIDLNQDGLTDVSGVASLPQTAAELASGFDPDIIPVTKVAFLDMLNSKYVVDSTTSPAKTIKDVVAEKIEGVAWGPDLPNGHHVLYITSDNDLATDDGHPTQIYAFEVDGAAAGITYVPQDLPGPLYPPGQVKKALDDKKDKKGK